MAIAIAISRYQINFYIRRIVFVYDNADTYSAVVVTSSEI